jgi:hypothetical protein
MSSEVVLSCGRLRIVFQRLSDRIRHRVEVFDAGTWMPQLESVEATGSDEWPSSPPLQTLHVEERPDGPVALLVGMAGRSHWSASVAADKSRSRMTFDIACRTAAASQWLGSTYHWLVESENAARQETRIVPMAATLMSCDESQLVLKAEIDQPSQQRTVRWGYSIEPSSL